MKKKYRIKIKREVKEFCLALIKEINSVTEIFQNFGINIKPALPNVFTQESIFFECIFSEEREHVLILFKSSGISDFIFTIVDDDVFNYFDKSGSWRKMPVGIRIENSTKINIESCRISGCKPFEIVGNNIELFFNNLSIDIPDQGPTTLEYGIVMSYKVFLERLKIVRDFTRDIIRAYFNFFKTFGVKYDPCSIESKKYTENLQSIKSKMEKYFFDDTTGELEIDEFIENNPIILEQCLNLTSLLHQVELKDLLNKYGQDLKPDLIGFDQNKRQWTIVDYKRAKRTIIKNFGQVRTSFRAEVCDLQAQLRDYREYFQEQTQRIYVREKYGYDIEFPTTIGVIGRVEQMEVRDFNRLREDLAKWIEIIPYNYIYDRFCRFIDTVNKIS